jgi:hypothetical protein
MPNRVVPCCGGMGSGIDSRFGSLRMLFIFTLGSRADSLARLLEGRDEEAGGCEFLGSAEDLDPDSRSGVDKSSLATSA